MTEKELKKLNRKQLLELLLIQTNRADELERQLSEARAELETRNITISNAGSIAEAALRLNNVFEAADAAAQQYLDNIRQIERDLLEKVSGSGVEQSENADDFIVDKTVKSKRIIRTLRRKENDAE